MSAQRYRPVKKLAVRVIDGKAVMLTIADSKLHRLNASATRVWQGIEAGSTVPEIVDDLCAAFAVTPGQALADVNVLLLALVDRGIVAPVPAEVVEAPG